MGPLYNHGTVAGGILRDGSHYCVKNTPPTAECFGENIGTDAYVAVGDHQAV